MKVLRILGMFVLVLMLVVGVMFILGAMLPVEHTAIVSAVINAPQQKVWDMIADTGNEAQWRKELKGVETAPDQDGQPCYREVQQMMKMTLCLVDASVPTRRVVRIADMSLPFGGTWIYELQPMDAVSTELTITEDGTVHPPIFRFLSHYVMGDTKSMDVYAKDLQDAVAQK
jgi:hypothetical protein